MEKRAAVVVPITEASPEKEEGPVREIGFHRRPTSHERSEAESLGGGMIVRSQSTEERVLGEKVGTGEAVIDLRNTPKGGRILLISVTLLDGTLRREVMSSQFYIFICKPYHNNVLVEAFWAMLAPDFHSAR